MTKIFLELVKQSVNEQPADMRAWAMFAVIDYDYHNSELCQYLYNFLSLFKHARYCWYEHQCLA